MIPVNTVIGYSRFVSTKNNVSRNCLVAHVILDMNMRDKSQGSTGQKCVDLFLDFNSYDYICTPETIGKVATIVKDAENQVTDFHFEK